MPQTINATKARENFSEIVNRVFYRGEEFIVEKQGKPMVLITKTGRAKVKPANKKIRGIEFLLRLSKYGLKGGPANFAKNHDKYIWE